MAQGSNVGYRIVGTVKSVKGHCNAGHKPGDRMEISVYSSGGLCGFFYHDIFPYLLMLQMGGSFPPEWGDPDVVEAECPDRTNAVQVRLQRVRE